MGDFKKSIDEKNGSLNDRPLFMQNGNGRVSISDIDEIGNFRRALPQFLAVSVKNILLFVYGMTLGFPTIVIPAIQGGDGREHSDIVLNKEEVSWFSSINLICVPLGCLFSGLLTQNLGKRRAMQLVNLPILASWLLFHFSSSTEHLYAALCLSGLGGGLMEAPVLTYVAEITEPKYRGILSALGSTCVITGIFIQFIAGSLMDWRTIAAVSSAFPVISMVTLFFIPESPTWLIRERRFREAVKSLQWLRGWVPEYKIEAEFNRLYEELITQPALEEAHDNVAVKPNKCNKFLRMFRKRSFIVPFMLVAFTFFVGHFSGKTTLQTYAVQIFHTLKAPINKYHATILLGVAEMIATIFCVFLIHFTGKRPLVMISTLGIGFCMFGAATYAHYLKIVPGFAVNNVVVNASSSVAKENIITQQNITNIFENILHETDSTAPKSNLTIFNSTLDYDDDDDLALMTTTIAANNANNSVVVNRTKRGSSLNEGYNDNLTFMDLDYLESNGTNLNQTSFELLNSEEDQADTLITTLLPSVSTLAVTTTTTTKSKEEQMSSSTQKSTVEKEKLPSTKEINQEILLPVPKQEKNNLVWIPLILLLAASFFAHLGIRMIPWILIGEVFPAAVRSTASGLVSGLGYIFGFLANKLFLQMLSSLTLPGTFWFYSCVAFLGAFILYYALPETEGRTLAEIEEHFSKKSKTNLHKSSKKKENSNNKINLQLENLQIPISPYTEAKIIQLQQSDFIQNHKKIEGEINIAYEEHNTTHL